MNREDIIGMARKAGLLGKPTYINNLEAFAALVASAEREKIAEYIDRNLMSCREYAEAIRARSKHDMAISTLSKPQA